MYSYFASLKIINLSFVHNCYRKSNHHLDSGSSDIGTPPSVITTLENIANNNGHPKSPTSSSSPVPVPSSRQRIDSMSSLGR